MACGLEGDDEQFAMSWSPGSYRALFVITIGPFFGKSETKILYVFYIRKISAKTGRNFGKIEKFS